MKTDTLIIGSGIAGGIAAITLAKTGQQVILVTKGIDITESNTKYAQGGIIYKGEKDSPALLTKDITLAGVNYSNSAAVNKLAKIGPRLVKDILIDELGCEFDQENGQISLTKEGGHSVARIAHSADKTGLEIENRIIAAIKKYQNIQIVHALAIDLLTPAHHSKNPNDRHHKPSCVGAYLYLEKEKQVIKCLAQNTVLATGGLGQVYRHTSNPEGAKGDGIALAHRSGARLYDLEYIQFHPTTLCIPGAPRSLISEAVRGEGARLVNADGAPFMDKYEPKWLDLAPRDRVARAIHAEMILKNTPNVFLDAKTYIPKNKLETHFPTIRKTCLKYGIDITKHLIPVTPAAHYSCGGVAVDLNGQTSIDHLYAIGEVACTGLHGANRLASTSLLEGLVWGYTAAKSITDSGPNEFDPKNYPDWVNTGSQDVDPALILQDQLEIQTLMWNYVGLIRTTPRLERAKRELSRREVEIEYFYQNGNLTGNLIGLRNLVLVARLITHAAWENKKSVGCHFRAL